MPTTTIGAELTAQVHRLYELIDANDVPGMLELFTEDVTYRRPGYEPLLGKAELARFYRGERVIAAGTHTPRRVFADGDAVAVHGSFLGVLKDGVDVALEYAEFFSVAPDGRFSSRQTYFFAPLV